MFFLYLNRDIKVARIVNFGIFKKSYLFSGTSAELAGGLVACKAEPGNGMSHPEREKDPDGDNGSLYLDPEGADEEDCPVSPEPKGEEVRECSGGDKKSKRNRPTEVERLGGVSLGDQIRTRSSILNRR